MSIATLKKVALVGLSEEKAQTLDRLQALGVMHITPLTQPKVNSQQSAELSDIAPERLMVALRYLEGAPAKRKQVVTQRHFDIDLVTHQVERNHQKRLSLIERQDFLGKRIRDLSVWGNFRLAEERELYDQRLWFYLVPNYKMHLLKELQLPWQVVHSDHRNSYLVVISESEPVNHQMPVPRTHTGAVPLSSLIAESEDIAIELEAVEAEREALTRWIYLMQCSIAGIEDRADRLEVNQHALDAGEVFALSGWVSDTQLSKLQAFARDNALAIEISNPEEGELPPTLLENPEFFGGGEEIVHFFQVPGYQSWDPSRLVFVSFAAFFALIMSDAGYALLLAAITLMAWKPLSVTASKKRMRVMLLVLSASSLIWGVLVGSYFGYTPQQGFFDRLHLFDLNDFDSMMKLSIFIGASHLIMANLMMAWVRRHDQRHRAALGWALLVTVALFGWLYSFSPFLIVLSVMALLLILLFSSIESTPLKRGMGGLYALTNITKAFGDVLSYLRLFALGLASASLAVTFNKLAMDVSAALPGIGFFLAGLILLIGHGLNFVLTVVSGVIHGLRLNLIEFYNWSLADEGYPFQPFAKREVTLG